jgi:hypothetical protein
MLTAVDWLWDELECLIPSECQEAYVKAKEMEKQQILEARLDIYTTGDLSAEEYYNKKFKQSC